MDFRPRQGCTAFCCVAGIISLLGFACPGTCPAQTKTLEVKSELQAIASIFRRRSPHYEDAVYRCERLLKRQDLDEATRRKLLLDSLRCYQGLRLHQQAAAACKALLALEGSTRTQKSDWLQQLAQAELGLKNYEAARKVFLELADLLRTAKPMNAVLARIRAARCVLDSDRAESAVQELVDLADSFPPDFIEARAKLLNAASDFSAEAGLGDQARALRESLLESPFLIGASRKTVELELADALNRSREYAGALTILRRVVFAWPFNLDAARKAQQKIVLTLLFQGRYRQAVREARRLLAISNQEDRAKSAEWVSRALKARDGHLVGANAFRRFVSYGPAGPDGRKGTPDDLKNPLEAERDRTLDEKSGQLLKETLERLPHDVAGLRARGYLLLLAGRTRDGSVAFRQAFQLCPPDPPARLRQAAQELAMADAACRGHWKDIPAVLAWLNYGPDGKDAVPGTSDDLKTPWPEK